jgi:nucleosome binding factor SPN SPT16 subunit
MYPNVKHAVYQPCDKTTMVLIHFHLKDPIMIGKKKQKDVQFYTEVIDASENLESSRRSAYDPDELDDEQRTKETRKRLNTAFKEFCQKVEKLAKHFEFPLTIDVPFRKSGFEGNCNKEMVFLQPTVNCLLNVTEMPFFVVTLSEIEHIHFERVTLSTRYFDLTIIYKNFDIPPRTIQSIQYNANSQSVQWFGADDTTARAAFLLKRGFKPLSRAFGAPTRTIVT